ATGKVRIVLKKVGGTKRITTTRSLIDGESVARLRVDRTGRFRVTVTYLGDAHTLRSSDSTNLRVS
ncbi:MAG: hypothetical protein QOH37_3359, partial [Nocardioidaceae bacterium]|nr:hypothetical protein [Nocardioidaceae bacterium]